MLEGLYSAAAGMAAQQEQLNAISNDLANLSTTGYKSERVAFSDLLYNPVNIAGTESTDGAGASARVIGRSEAQGSIQETGDPLDLAIEGPGYFQVTRADGQMALTRDGSFGSTRTARSSTPKAAALTPPIKLPAGVSPSEVRIAPRRHRERRHAHARPDQARDRDLARTHARERQRRAHADAASGAPHPATGKIHQGALEASNVNIAGEMALMVSTQRNYQLTSTAIQTRAR